MRNTGAREDVLVFYEKLPFNATKSPENTAALIKKINNVKYIYPDENDLYYADSILELGCGAGWLSNSLAYYYGADVWGVDFNPAAINEAEQASVLLGTNVHFECADLFQFACSPADIVISVGVLHHTSDVRGGVCRCIELTKSCGKVFIGLYHKYGRKPFLDYFKRLKEEGKNQETLFAKYRELDKRNDNDIQTKSWFLDQVLHPYETQHTLKEVVEIFRENGVELISTSINNYGEIHDLEKLFEDEKELYDVGKECLNKQIYYPGIFYVLGQKKQA